VSLASHEAGAYVINRARRRPSKALDFGAKESS
jgi:hypothetical protein